MDFDKIMRADSEKAYSDAPLIGAFKDIMCSTFCTGSYISCSKLGCPIKGMSRREFSGTLIGDYLKVGDKK